MKKSDKTVPFPFSIKMITDKLSNAFNRWQEGKKKTIPHPVTPYTPKEEFLRDTKPIEKIQQSGLTATQAEEDILCMKGITLLRGVEISIGLEEIQKSLKDTPAKVEETAEKGVVMLSKTFKLQNGEEVVLKGKFKRIKGEMSSIPIPTSFKIQR